MDRLKLKFKNFGRDKSPASSSPSSKGNDFAHRPATTPTTNTSSAASVDVGIALARSNDIVDSAVGSAMPEMGVVNVAAASPSVASSTIPTPVDKETGLATETVPTSQAGVSSVGLLNKPVRDLWSDALAQLDDPVKQEIHKSFGMRVAQLSAPRNMDELIELTKDRQKECEDKAYKFKLGKRVIILSDVAAKTAGWLERFKTIGDVAVSFDPTHAALPWAAVKLLLQAAVGEQEQRGQLLLSIEKVAYLIDRCTIYEYLFTPDNVSEEVLKVFQNALVELYAGILRLLAFACQTYCKGIMRRTASAFGKPKKVEDLRSKLQGLEDRVEMEAQNCERQRSQEADSKILQLLDKPLLRIDSLITSALERLDYQERIEILEWYSSIPFTKLHTTIADERAKETCMWLSDRKEYSEWFNSSSSMILWLHGRVGTGKTHLVSKVVDEVRDALASAPNHEGFAFFYCNRNELDRRQPLSILRSFVRQLSTIADHSDSMQAELREYYHDSRGCGAEPTMADCQKLILKLTNLYPKTTLILDALDECEEQKRRLLLQTFDDILLHAEKPVKIFISSRPDSDIKERFKSLDNIGIQASDNDKDISKFIEAEIVNHPKWNKMNIELQKFVIETLQDKSQGMFQWAYLQIKQLLEEKQEKGIRQRLGKLPEDLKKAYDEIYNGLSDSEKLIADRAFKWVMCAEEPLMTEALLLAVCQDGNGDKIQPVEDLDEDLLLESCHHLLVIDPQRGVWIPSHLSVVEYMETRGASTSDAHCLVASVCLILLNEPTNFRFTEEVEYPGGPLYMKATSDSEVIQESDTPNNDSTNIVCATTPILGLHHPLRNYAVVNWMQHARECDDIRNEYLSSLLKRFLGSPTHSSKEYQAWQNMYSSYYGREWYSKSRDMLEDIKPAAFAAFAICRFGFYTSVEEWWTCRWSESSEKSQTNASLLQLAASGGSISICKRLIAWGADVNEESQHKKWGSALGAAIVNGKKEVVQLLLKHNADVNAHLNCDGWGSALEAAIAGNRPSMVQLLLDNGADANMLTQSGSYGCALAVAAESRDMDITQLLLQQGVDINLQLQCGDYGSALAAAASSYNNTSKVQLLLNKGADVNQQLQCGVYGSALAAAAAASHGDISTVQLLLDRGADMNLQLQCGNYGSALAAAATSLSDDTSKVQLLLDRGADVNLQLQCGDFGSALAAASSHGKSSTAELLLDKGADVNLQLQCGHYGSALAAAAAASSMIRSTSTVQLLLLLLDKGADVNQQLQCGNYGSALAAASFHGDFSTVQLLLDKGADVNQQLQYGYFGSALAAAAASGFRSTSTVQLLLDRGVDVNLQLQCGDFGSAFAAALSEAIDSEEAIGVVKLLLDQGALMNTAILNGKYSSAIAMVLDYQEDNTVEGNKRAMAEAFDNAVGIRKELAQLLIANGATLDPCEVLRANLFDSYDGTSQFLIDVDLE